MTYSPLLSLTLYYCSYLYPRSQAGVILCPCVVLVIVTSVPIQLYRIPLLVRGHDQCPNNHNQYRPLFTRVVQAIQSVYSVFCFKGLCVWLVSCFNKMYTVSWLCATNLVLGALLEFFFDFLHFVFITVNRGHTSSRGTFGGGLFSTLPKSRSMYGFML